MGQAIPFDTHEYVKKLKAAGVPENQAEVHAEAIAKLVDERLVTKQYLDMRLAELKADITRELIKWILGVSAAQAALIVAILKLL
ncbi:MAG: DUF1640 domain-containing protein [Nitrospirota bacterium]